MKQALAYALSFSLLAGCGSSGSDDPDVEPGTVGISGVASGIAGDVTLSINGQFESISENGAFSLETRVDENASYNITIFSTEDGLTCEVLNGSGTTTTVNITDVQVNCDATEQTAYSINDLAFNVEEPSVISFAFHLIDRYTGTAVNDINSDNVTDYLEVLENDLPISPSESFLEVDQFQDFNTEYTTVFVVDISSSLQSEELDSVKTSIINAVLDSSSNESKLDANQSVTVFTFDGDVTEVVTASKDPQAIKSAVEAIEIGGNSTNLYGAIKTGVEAWTNEISLEKIQHGSMVLFTDGVDTSNLVSKSSALAATTDKDIYFIAIGSETDTSDLRDFTSTDNILAIDDFDQVATALNTAIEEVKTYEQGLYILSYATPKRAGNHSITIKGNDDFRCDTAVSEEEEAEIANNGELSDCTDSITHTFDADNFTDVEATLKLSGTYATLVPELDWQVKLRWSRETPNYDWNVQVCQGSIQYDIAEGESQISFTRTGSSVAVAFVTVDELETGQQASSYLIMATTPTDFAAYQTPLLLDRVCAN